MGINLNTVGGITAPINPVALTGYVAMTDLIFELLLTEQYSLDKQ